MTTANLLKNTAYPVRSSMAELHKNLPENSGVYMDYFQPSFTFSLPPFAIKLPASSNGLDALGFRIYQSDGTLYTVYANSLIVKHRVSEDSVLYDYYMYYGEILRLDNYTPIPLPCGDYYAAISIGGELYYTEPFRVYDTYNLSSENNIINGDPIQSTTGWVTPQPIINISDNSFVIGNNGSTSTFMYQDIDALPAPWLYKLTVEYSTSIGELRMVLRDGSINMIDTALSGSGTFEQIVQNPTQILFSWTTASEFNSGRITSIKLNRILNISCFHRLVWSNSCTLAGIPYKIESTRINRFYQSVHITAEVSQPEYIRNIEDVRNELGVLKKDSESLERHVICNASPVPSYLVDALQIMPMHDDISLVNILGNIITSDYVTAAQPEWKFGSSSYALQKLDFIEETNFLSNCCSIVTINCPSDIPTAIINTSQDEDTNEYGVSITLTGVGGYENALFKLRKSEGLPPDCSTDYYDLQDYTLEQINNDLLARYNTFPDGKKHCFYFVISLPGCPDVDGEPTNVVSFTAS